MFVTPSRPLLSGILGLALLALAPLAGRRGTINAQSPPLDVETSGRRYVVAFPDTTQNHPPGGSVAKFRDEFDLFIYSATDSNRVTIVQPDGNSTKLTLRGGAFQVIPITSSPVADRINVAQRRAISVDATAPVVLYCYMATRFGMEAWTPIPVEMWGTEYSAAALPSGSVADVGYVAESKVFSTVKPAPSEILVIAAYDNTKVAIRPSAAQHLAGTTAASVEVTLRAGECYQVQSDAHIDASGEGEQTDLGGVVVRADKPIGVISGNTRTLVRQDQTGLLGNVYKGMVMEWLPPRDQQGTEFVYLPSWDKHRPGIDARAERAGEYVRAYSGSQPLSYTSLDNGAVTGHAMTHDSLSELLLPAVDAVYLRSQKPMQAFMHSPSVLQLVAKVTCFLGYPPCQIYAAWAPYMVEMTPREQWGSFAPYYAPTVPAGMEHNINVVTDTASARHIFTEEGDLFPFTRRIPGTDLIWGSRAVVPGVSHYLVGVGGARFYGYVYGTLAGREHYSPTRTRKSDDPEIASGGEEPGAEQLMAGTYEEDNALSYAYPLSPRRSVLAPPDSLEVVRGRACGTLLLQVRTLNPRPSGIRSIELDRGMSANARLEFVEPLAAADITGSSSAYVKVVPVDESKGIVARIAITDRTGRITYVDHVYDPPRVDVSARAIDFGALSVGSSRDTVTVPRFEGSWTMRCGTPRTGTLMPGRTCGRLGTLASRCSSHS